MEKQDGKVKFVRIGGRIVPIRQKNFTPKNLLTSEQKKEGYKHFATNTLQSKNGETKFYAFKRKRTTKEKFASGIVPGGLLGAGAGLLAGGDRPSLKLIGIGAMLGGAAFGAANTILGSKEKTIVHFTKDITPQFKQKTKKLK
jgi:hypothetical protein